MDDICGIVCAPKFRKRPVLTYTFPNQCLRRLDAHPEMRKAASFSTLPVNADLTAQLLC